MCDLEKHFESEKAATIHDLPEEVLIEILKYLDPKSVKEASLVCLDWNRLISTSPAVMRKFLLTVDHRSLDLESYESFKELLTVQRHFVTMKMVFATGSIKERMENVIQHFGVKLLELELREVKMKESELVLKLLKHTPQLVVLHLNIWKSKEGSDQLAFEPTSVELKMLKKIVSTEHANWKIFNCLLTPRLTSLECHGGDDDFEPKSFEDFLRTLPNLESLMLDFKHISKMDSAFPFKLKKLSCSTFDCNFDESLKRFFISQSSTLRKLAAACESPEFFEFIFTKMSKLEKLSSNFNLLPTSRDFYFKLKPMLQLKELNVKRFSSEVSMQGVLGNCPELLTLAVATDLMLPDRLKFISNHNPKLESLSVSEIRDTLARFESLKALQIDHISDADNLIEFLRINPTVDTFSVSNQRENFEDGLLNFLLHETNIKHVSVHGRSIFDLFEQIKAGYGNLETLELKYRDGRLDSPCFVRFEFPKNPEDWIPHEQLQDYFEEN